MIGIIIFFVWTAIEAYFYSIAVDAQKNYTDDLLKQAQERYDEINNIRNLPQSLGTLYIKKKNEFQKVDSSLLIDTLLKKYHQNGFVYSVKNEKKYPSKYIYTIDKEKKRMQYFYNNIAIDMDASYYFERITSVWLKFFFVSFFFTAFILTLIFLIRFLVKKSMSYKHLSNTLELKVKEQTKKLDLAFEGAQLGYWYWNIQTGSHEVDERWLRMLGLQKEELSHTINDWQFRIHPDDYERIMPLIKEAIAKKRPYIIEFRILHANGDYIWVQDSGAVTRVDDNSNALELAGTYQEITKRKKLEQEHVKNELYLQTLFDKSPNIIIITTGKSIIRANEAFFNFFKEYASLEEFKQEHNCICEFFCSSQYDDTILGAEVQWIKDVLSLKEPIVKICYLKQEYYFSVYAKKIYEDNQMHMMTTFNDITEMYKIRHTFEDLSMQDALTAIYNRRYFNVVFPKELNRAKRVHESFCFAIMDVDNFKLYNDNYGHDAGDEVLQKITAKITQLTQRANEFFFRLGGEEFGFICSAYTKEETLQHLKNICEEVENLHIEHLYNEWYEVVTISIGICYLADASQGEVKLIYKSADNALYKAKETGRNKVVLFEEC